QINMSQQNGRQQRPMFAYPSLSLVQVTGFRTQSRRPIFFVKRFANNRQLCILRKPVLKDSVKCFCFWHAFVSKKNRQSKDYRNSALRFCTLGAEHIFRDGRDE